MSKLAFVRLLFSLALGIGTIAMSIAIFQQQPWVKQWTWLPPVLLTVSALMILVCVAILVSEKKWLRSACGKVQSAVIRLRVIRSSAAMPILSYQGQATLQLGWCAMTAYALSVKNVQDIEFTTANNVRPVVQYHHARESKLFADRAGWFLDKPRALWPAISCFLEMEESQPLAFLVWDRKTKFFAPKFTDNSFDLGKELIVGQWTVTALIVADNCTSLIIRVQAKLGRDGVVAFEPRSVPLWEKAWLRWRWTPRAR